MRARYLTWLAVLALGCQTAPASPVEIASLPQQTTLLELYTSEGCSSCPPADRWFSALKNDARVWREIVPVAFHVDYWNSLGWRDRFSDARYSARQRNYFQYHYTKGVYTPGLMANGREWRQWSGLRKLPQPPTNPVGVLTAAIDGDTATVEFHPVNASSAAPMLNVAFLGFDQKSDVTAGENRGEELVHDFVVLAFRKFPQTEVKAPYRWRLEKVSDLRPAQASGIAIWITAGDDPTPLQAAGGWL